MNAKRKDQSPTVDHPAGAKLDWRQGLGGALILVGFILLIVGYVQISGTTETYDQLTYFLADGIGGAAAIIVGSTVLIIREHNEDRHAIRLLDERLSDLDRRLPRDTMRGEESPGAGSSEGRDSGVGASADARQHA